MAYPLQWNQGFIIDTNEYSGNFERQLCAYMTGQIGDCGVGDKEVELFEKSKCDPIAVNQVPDENGCCRPCTIYTTPGMVNDGRGKHYKESEAPKRDEPYYPAYCSVIIFLELKPNEDEIKMLKRRAKRYFKSVYHMKNKVQVTGFRWVSVIAKIRSEDI